MTDTQGPFRYSDMFSVGTPEPEQRFAGFPRYNFVGGHNDPAQIPTDALAEAAATVIRRDGQKLAMYNLGQGGLGYIDLRQFLARKLHDKRGIACSANDILITTGSGQGLDFVNQLLVGRGDTVIMEEFSYLGAINKARRFGAEVIGIPLDDGGMRMDLLAEALADLKSRGVTPKYIYTIPTVQNPTGSVLNLERRKTMIALSIEYGVPIFEDECYADLAWAIDAPPSLYALAPSQVIHIGSFSKSLAPALRVGYAVAHWDVIGRMLSAKSDGGTGALDQMVAAEYFSHHFDDHIARLSNGLKYKMEVILDAVEREFGTAVEISKPEGGIFVWLRFPDSVDVRSFVKRAGDAGVAFNPGPEWSTNPEAAKSSIRLCFALPDVQAIRDGVAALARACFEETGIPARGSNKLRANGAA